MILFSEGLSYRQIATKLKLPNWEVPRKWKAAKYPEDWDNYRREISKKRLEKMQKDVLDSLPKIRIKQQKAFNALTGQMTASLIRKAQSGRLEGDVMLDTLRLAVEENQKLYLELAEVHAPKGSRMGIGAQFNTKTGEIGILGMIEEAYDTRKSNGDNPTLQIETKS